MFSSRKKVDPNAESENNIAVNVSIGYFMWENFIQNLNKAPSAQFTMESLKGCIVGALRAQGADFSKMPRTVFTAKQLFKSMDYAEIQNIATHLIVAAQLTKTVSAQYEQAKQGGVEYALAVRPNNPLLQLALDQHNPYLLRLHVYYLYHRMQALMTPPVKEQSGSEERRISTADEATKILSELHFVAEMKFPALAHLLAAYAHATLAMGSTDPEYRTKQWKSAYEQILLTNETKSTNRCHMFIVNRGQNLFQGLPHEKGFDDFKAEVEGILGKTVAAEVERSLKATDSRLTMF